jgi:predicted GH43/DUF377 family glycosyl hydrolase
MNRKNKFSVLLVAMVIVIACQPQKNKSTDWAILPFNKVDSVNPILAAGSGEFTCPILKQNVKWEEKDVFNPAAVVRNDTVFILYRAEDTIGKFAGTSRIGLAYSTDGLHFTRRAEPVLFPDEDFMKQYEWEGGIEDPRIMLRDDGTYVLTYTAYDGTLARLCIASSKDLIHWSKHGLVFDGKYKDTWSKSGAIVGKKEGNKIVAQKLNGKYWMYFGDTDLFIASSDDLIHWQPVEEKEKLKSVLQPRKNYFDSRLVESGPFALVTKDGVLLPYNGMNLQTGGDAAIEADAYCAGQALYDLNDPSKLINRLEKNFLMPEKKYELEGQVHRVCFIEGMVTFKEKWFLYYGTADSKIAVAVSEIK